uniref:PWWP domain-containing protein n=1 Tax=Crocodylus porosus TaxID=8502 RepID=A0A7M4FCK2_CROPO
IMTDPEYVLCRWKKRLWPAKVITLQTLVDKALLSLLHLKFFKSFQDSRERWELTKITCTDPEPLERERIQIIGSELGKDTLKV